MPTKDTGKHGPHAGKDDKPGTNNNERRAAAAISTLTHTIAEQEKANRKEQAREDSGKRFREYLTLAFVVLTTIGIFIQAGILHTSDSTFSETLETQRASNERQLRAYVLVDAASVTKFDTGPTEAHVILKNYGQTPAYDFEAVFVIEMTDFPRKHSYSLDGSAAPSPNVVVLGPGAIAHGYPFTKRPLTTGEVADVKNGSGAIYVFGTATYRDAFQKLRHTSFRYFYGGTAGTRDGGFMQPAQGGNSAD